MRRALSMLGEVDDAVLVVMALGLRIGRTPEIRRALDGIGGLRGLRSAGSEGLASILASAPAARLEAVLEILRRLMGPGPLGRRVDGPEAVMDLVGADLALAHTESIWVVCLDARGRSLGVTRVFEGTLTSCLVHPREIFAVALRARAASVVVVHNHPSGDPEPSEEDFDVTSRLFEAGEVLGIPVVDHLVVGRSGFRSLGQPENPSSLVRCGPARAGALSLRRTSG